MPFNKRKQEKQLRTKEINDGRVLQEQQFEDAIKKAGQIEDPAAKVLALRKVADEITAQVRAETNQIEKFAGKKMGRTTLAGLAPAAAGGTAVGLFAGPAAPLAIPAAIFVLAGAAVVGDRRANAAEKKLKAASALHRSNLIVQAAWARKLADTVVENNVEAISKSPLFRQVKEGNTALFAKAAAKHIATAKPPEAEETPAVADTAPKRLRLVKKDDNQPK